MSEDKRLYAVYARPAIAEAEERLDCVSHSKPDAEHYLSSLEKEGKYGRLVEYAPAPDLGGVLEELEKRTNEPTIRSGEEGQRQDDFKDGMRHVLKKVRAHLRGDPDGRNDD